MQADEQIDPVSAPVSEVREETLAKLWAGRIPTGLIPNFAGDGGVGRSHLMAALTAAVTAGLPFRAGSRRPTTSERLFY